MSYEQNYETFRLVYLGDTEKAYKVCKPGQKPFWVAKSQCKSCTKFAAEPGKPVFCEIAMTEWIAKKVGLLEEDREGDENWDTFYNQDE